MTDVVQEYCMRVLGPGPLANEAATQANEEGAGDRVSSLAAAARACRERAGRQQRGGGTVMPSEHSERRTLLAAVAAELAAATAELPERHREALALREAVRLSHEEISSVLGIERAAIAPLLARARLTLRAKRRGLAEVEATCTERDRALRCLAVRQDSESLGGEEDDWLFDHLGACGECSRAHAAMLEASVCYRAWDPRADGSSAESASAAAADLAQ